MPLSRFEVVACADPQTLIRLLNYFAQVGLLPARVNAVEACGLVTIRIHQHGLSEQQARIIAEKMRGSVLVDAVQVRRGRRLLTPLSETIEELSA
jgi:hypothetical protein